LLDINHSPPCNLKYLDLILYIEIYLIAIRLCLPLACRYLLQQRQRLHNLQLEHHPPQLLLAVVLPREVAAETSQSLCNALMPQARLLHKRKSHPVMTQFMVAAPETKRQLTAAAAVVMAAVTAAAAAAAATVADKE
jgi:hypothetical protein